MKQWWKAAGVRALKTAAQTLVSLIGTGAVGITELDWPQMLSITATAAVLSLLTSIAGLPELDSGTGTEEPQGVEPMPEHMALDDGEASDDGGER